MHKSVHHICLTAGQGGSTMPSPHPPPPHLPTPHPKKEVCYGEYNGVVLACFTRGQSKLSLDKRRTENGAFCVVATELLWSLAFYLFHSMPAKPSKVRHPFSVITGPCLNHSDKQRVTSHFCHYSPLKVWRPFSVITRFPEPGQRNRNDNHSIFVHHRLGVEAFDNQTECMVSCCCHYRTIWSHDRWTGAEERRMLTASSDDGRPCHHHARHRQGILRRYGQFVLPFCVPLSKAVQHFVCVMCCGFFHAVGWWQCLDLLVNIFCPSPRSGRKWWQCLDSVTG